jgi:hypothetical protein
MRMFYSGVPRVCLKIEEMTDFCPEGLHFKEKTASQSSDWRGFLTQKGAAYGLKDGVFDFSTKP